MGEEDGTSDDRETLISTFDEEAMGMMAAVKGVACGGSSIAERRAAKFGFNAVKISTPRFRTNSPSASPAARSPCCITLPAGISPSALLDSPIMLPNAQALPSPTTGTFPLPSFSHESSILNSATCEDGDKGNAIDSFIFKPYGDDKSPPRCSSFGDKSQQTDVVDQAMVLEKSSAGFEFPTEFAGEATTKYCLDSSNGAKFFNDISMEDKSVDMKMSPEMACVQTSLSREPIHGDDSGTHDLSEGNQNESNQSIGTGKTSEDGYNWRKYGQKQVKGSEYPRSYYKCTHPNCHVKKKVERSHDGQITEIIYKGGHNHSKPQPNRRAALGSGLSSDEMSEVSEGSGNCLKIEDRSVWTNVQLGSASNKLGSDGMEITSSASVLSELSDPLSATHGKPIAMIESTEIPEPSSTVVSHEDDEDGAILGTVLVEGDADDEEPESKRRKQESGVLEASLAPRAVREPRVVVQIESDVDILDDGYRWRKYGQKVVKGNPNPRSYYKCTSAGCSVRKHVERASHNLKCVITTYEGKHNHEVPVARNSSHMNSSGANGPPAAANNAQSPLTFSRNTSILKPETEIQDLAPPFDRKPEFSNEYLRPSFHGNFSNDVRFGASSLYPMKFPPLQSSIPYASFGLNPNRMAIQQASPVAPVVPDFPMSLPLALPPSGNLSLVGFNFNSGKPVAPVQPMLSGQHLQQNDMRFLRPKQEQKDDILYDASMPLTDHTDASSLSSYPSSPVYSQFMGSFPS